MQYTHFSLDGFIYIVRIFIFCIGTSSSQKQNEISS